MANGVLKASARAENTSRLAYRVGVGLKGGFSVFILYFCVVQSIISRSKLCRLFLTKESIILVDDY